MACVWSRHSLLTLVLELSGADLQLASVLSLGTPSFHLYAVLCLMGLKLRSLASAGSQHFKLNTSPPFIRRSLPRRRWQVPEPVLYFRVPASVQVLSPECVLGGSFLGCLLVLILCSRSQIQALSLSPEKRHHDPSYTVSR